MAVRPLMLGAIPPALVNPAVIGLGNLQPVTRRQLPTPSTARSRAAAEALQGATRPLGSTNPIEALARVAETYLKGRGARKEYEREEAEKRARDDAYRAAAAIRNADPRERLRLQSEAIAEGDPTAAFQAGLALTEDELAESRGERTFQRERTARLEDAPRLAGIENDAYVAREERTLPLRVREARETYPYRFAPDSGGGRARLTPQEQRRVGDASTAAESASSLRDYATEFRALNARVRTGPGSGAWGLGQVFNQQRARMNQLSTQMLLSLNRPGFTSAVSDADREMLAKSVPNTDIDGRVNDTSVEAINQAARNVEDRASFLDQYSARGSLQGAEQIWREYRRMNPIFDRHGGLRTNRPTFDQWIQMGAPDMSRGDQYLAPSSRDRAAPASALVRPSGQQSQRQQRELPKDFGGLWTPY